MSIIRQCCLEHIESKRRLILPSSDVFILGRNPQTDIRDLMVSRKQIVCQADVEENTLKIKPVGRAISAVNGFALHSNQIYTTHHGDILELRAGNHKFVVVFSPEPRTSSDTEESPLKRPKMDFPIFNLKAEANACSTKSFDGGVWEEIDNKELLIFTSKVCKGKSKIAAFDIDGTVIKTKSGARFPKYTDDWILNYSVIKDQLKDLVNNNYKIVLFTNQSGVGNDSTKIKEFKKKIEAIINSLNLPIQAFISLGKRNYRKPRIGMWEKLATEKNEDVAIDLSESFYVGDAAGREKNWMPKKNKDHSTADRLFALNIGIKFYTPEEYFLKQKPAPYKMPEFDPRIIPKDLTLPDLEYDKLNVVLMVGGPGSGKSVLCKNFLVPKGYVHVSRDNLGSWQKCVKAMEESLQSGKNVVIDNTNVDKLTRQRFIQAAKKYNVAVRCFLMTTSINHIRHNNKFRELTDTSHAVVSDIIIFSYRKNYEEPEMSEGYSQILQIPFIYNSCSNPDLEKFYKMFLLE